MTPMPGSARSSWIRWLLLAIAGLLFVPAIAYLLASRVIGPYGGDRGVATYFSSIYADALAGRPFAVLLLLAPVLVAGAWRLRRRLLTRTRAALVDQTK